MTTAVSYYRPPNRSRFNVRPLIFAAVVLGLLGWPIYTFVRQAMGHGVIDHGEYAEVNLKALGFFDFDPASGTIKDVPQNFRELDGRRVVLDGQVFDPSEANGITHFEFVYSITKCCFGGPPKVQERVFAQVPRGTVLQVPNADYCRVTGILHVKLEHDGAGQVSAVYTLDVEKLEAM